MARRKADEDTAASAPVALDRTPAPVRGEALPDLDILHSGVVLFQGPPVSGKASFFLQALVSAANKGLAVGYISGGHPSFVTRQLEATLTYLGLTSKNLYLFPDTPSEAIEAVRLKKLIKDCNLNILCIDDFPDHLATKAEVRTAEAISRESGCPCSSSLDRARLSRRLYASCLTRRHDRRRCPARSGAGAAKH